MQVARLAAEVSILKDDFTTALSPQRVALVAEVRVLPEELKETLLENFNVDGV